LTGSPAIDAARVLDDLDALAELTGGPQGARRVCWTDEWVRARDFLRERLVEIGVEETALDDAGNLWARLPGADRDAPAAAIGSHLDSVPSGGPLDGALGVLAGLGVLRSWAESGMVPPRDLVLLDFADEEGSRFGRSLFGSSALAGTLEPTELAGLRDADGEPIGEVLSRFGVEVEAAPAASSRLRELGSYVELHIEQGPVLEAEGFSCSAVSGTAGVEREHFVFSGQASHAGTTPMDQRRDAGLAAAETALAVERIATRHGGVGTTGNLALEPGVITAVPGRAELGIDLRHPAADPLAAMRAEVLDAGRDAAGRHRCELDRTPIWRIEPIRFDAALVASAEEAAARVGGRADAMPSGALHDAAEMARRIPTAMIFVASIGGISHAKEERSDEGHLASAIEAFASLAGASLSSL
jgi:N-carbamoyl-L-amino-acid hydrolase